MDGEVVVRYDLMWYTYPIGLEAIFAVKYLDVLVFEDDDLGPVNLCVGIGY